ncbi:MAG TPA: FAD binding domain-containing protein, partial [Candidatus Thermoplasmatota archaeon]|nr:FAD binding domain-containing protein [Candidatus Thermoplasmatota archaeon]
MALREALPVLPTTAAMIASPLLRASGTLGGNLCLDTRCYYFNQGFSWRESKGFCLKADGDVCLVVPQKEKCYATFSADLPAPLIALGARVHLAGPDGAREMPLKDFYRGDGIERNVRRPDEIVTFVDLPPSARRLRAAYTKLRLRESWDFPELGIAVALRLDGDRLAECHIVANALETTPRVLDDVAAPHLG